MGRGPLFQENYRPQFTGHETFPLRYGWLKKAYDAVATIEESKRTKAIFLDGNAIARFGVGKNMVSSIRHWASATGIIEELPNSKLCLTKMGEMLFDDKGLDPYMENPATIWILHWKLAAYPTKTTWFWAFNYYYDIDFDRDHLVNGLLNLAQDCGWRRISPTTIKNDVSCFTKMYSSQRDHSNQDKEDSFESPLTELGLVQPTGKREGFRFKQGLKSNLGIGVFIYSLLDFWGSYSSNTATLSFEAIVHEPGSPGRVFLLDEDSVLDFLQKVNEYTQGNIIWSESAGLKQISRKSNYDLSDRLSYIKYDYPSPV